MSHVGTVHDNMCSSMLVKDRGSIQAVLPYHLLRYDGIGRAVLSFWSDPPRVHLLRPVSASRSALNLDCSWAHFLPIHWVVPAVVGQFERVPEEAISF